MARHFGKQRDLPGRLAMTMKKIALAIAATLALAACGTERDDRTLGGAAVGATAGAGVGALFGGVGAIPGALIGGAVGAGTGYVTDPKDVNLGEPLWTDNPGRR
jgi:uncharacterized membrane protein